MPTFQECGFGPYSVTEILHITLAMTDGTLIALKLWIPSPLSNPDTKFREVFTKCKFSKPKEIYVSESTTSDPEPSFPAILEFLPYNKDHWTGPRDFNRHPWFASHGYVCVRGDIRGSGTSTGLLIDEYLPSEQADCIEIINWIAKQPWSNGKVGMYGKSWGGFNGLQVAFEQPEPLKAVISAYSLDDRYADDIHYMGGCVLGNGMLSWSSQMFLWQANPPHPKFFDNLEEWKVEWRKRLKGSSKSLLVPWLSRQDRRDPYWCHGSIIEDISRVECPVLVIGGLADGYTNASFRMGATLNKESRTVIGPWSHNWPDIAHPGPRIDFLNLCLTWWQYHLKGSEKADEDVSKWARLRLYMRESIPPAKYYDTYPGFWLNISNWDDLYKAYESAIVPDNETENSSDNLLKLSISQENKLILRERDPETEVEQMSLKCHGLQGDAGGEWVAWGGLDLPGDQQRANEHSYVWETEPLEEDLVVAGFTMVTLVVRAKKEAKYGLAVRLCDIFPTGESSRITYGIKNVSHWKGEKNPEKKVPANQELSVPIQLNGVAYVVPKGHRLALVVSPSYFPLMLTTSESEGLVLYPQKTEIIIQTLPKDALERKKTYFRSPMQRISLESQVRRPSRTNELSSFVRTDDGCFTCESTSDDGDIFYPHLGVGISETTQEVYKINGAGNWSKATSNRKSELDFPDQKVRTRVETHSVLEDKGDFFAIQEKLKVVLNEEDFYENEWIENVERIYA